MNDETGRPGSRPEFPTSKNKSKNSKTSKSIIPIFSVIYDSILRLQTLKAEKKIEKKKKKEKKAKKKGNTMLLNNPGAVKELLYIFILLFGAKFSFA